jgi:hypothetical protein
MLACERLDTTILKWPNEANPILSKFDVLDNVILFDKERW